MTRALISALTGGRPAMGRAESLVQCSQKRRRCHRRTVLGDTMTRACLQPAHTLDSATQKVGPAHLRPGHRPLVDSELVAQGQVLQGDMAVSAAEEGKQSKQAEQESNHRAGIFSGSAPPDQSLGRRTEFWRRTGERYQPATVDRRVVRGY